ncbi:7249_t:CDS:2, partial [Dentiscutata heterogama]
MEQGRTPDFYQFWDELMTERLKYHGRQLRSSYREEGTYSGKRSNSTLCSDQISRRGKKGNSNVGIISDDVIEITKAVYQQHTDKNQEIQKEGSDSISLAEVEENEVIEVDAISKL